VTWRQRTASARERKTDGNPLLSVSLPIVGSVSRSALSRNEEDRFFRYASRMLIPFLIGCLAFKLQREREREREEREREREVRLLNGRQKDPRKREEFVAAFQGGEAYLAA